jgi:hypothetical protein
MNRFRLRPQCQRRLHAITDELRNDVERHRHILCQYEISRMSIKHCQMVLSTIVGIRSAEFTKPFANHKCRNLRDGRLAADEEDLGNDKAQTALLPDEANEFDTLTKLFVMKRQPIQVFQRCCGSQRKGFFKMRWQSPRRQRQSHLQPELRRVGDFDDSLAIRRVLNEMLRTASARCGQPFTGCKLASGFSPAFESAKLLKDAGVGSSGLSLNPSTCAQNSAELTGRCLRRIASSWRAKGVMPLIIAS